METLKSLAKNTFILGGTLIGWITFLFLDIKQIEIPEQIMQGAIIIPQYIVAIIPALCVGGIIWLIFAGVKKIIENETAEFNLLNEERIKSLEKKIIDDYNHIEFKTSEQSKIFANNISELIQVNEKNVEVINENVQKIQELQNDISLLRIVLRWRFDTIYSSYQWIQNKEDFKQILTKKKILEVEREGLFKVLIDTKGFTKEIADEYLKRIYGELN